MIDITYGAKPEKKTAVALGYFDGLHLGHVYVINKTLSQKGLMPAVFTFNCDTTLPKFTKQEDIISFENKREMLEKMGVEYLYAPDYADVSELSYERFVSEVLVKKLNVGFACCGESFRFGKGGEGTPKRLSEMAEKYGFSAYIAEDICLDGEPVSSTRIREFIREGKIEEANRLLGYELRFKLPVVYGNRIGRKLSFPTINQIIPDTNIVPRFGAYKSFVQVDGKNLRGVTNIGIRPTVGKTSGVVMETHIINFSGDLYGREIAVSLCGFLRGEKKFADLSELKEQIAKDIKNTL
ncbi:MAG: riboflavin biosynthesis protein RibF [Oscillospiraceae bacterium]|nr:riboflavin biosynthesis protein RibF [Oscillospiraceae bacterium]